jgi:hypothetical protein
MVRHPGCFTRHATPTTRLDSIEALAEIFSLRRGSTALLSGVAWTYWNYLAVSPGDFETSAKTWAMKIHGAAAMATLVLIGMLLNGHVRFAWRAGRNRANGSVFLSALAALTITGYGLYYAGGERLRAWTSWIHLAVGLALPILLVIHIFVGRRTRRSGQSRTRSRLASLGAADGHPKLMTTSPSTALSDGSNSG